MKERLVADVATIKMGDVSDFENFMGAVIDEGAFRTHSEAITEARAAGAEILTGGSTDDSEGYFVQPTVITTEDKGFRLLRDELFGPIVTTYVYDEKRWDDTLQLVDETAPYGLTGAVFATEREAIEEAQDALRYAAGNFYVNDKPTGAVVGQQPFGGSRASGTNDKAGSMWNLIRWVSPRTIKETFVPPTDYRYPFLGPDGDGSPASGWKRIGVVRVLDGIDAFLDQLAAVDPLPSSSSPCSRSSRSSPARAWRGGTCSPPRIRTGSCAGGRSSARTSPEVGVNAIVPLRAGDAVRVLLAHRAVAGSTYTTVVSSTLVLSIFDIAAASTVLAGRPSRRMRFPASATCRGSRASTSRGFSTARWPPSSSSPVVIARCRGRDLDPRARRRLLGTGQAGVHRRTTAGSLLAHGGVLAGR